MQRFHVQADRETGEWLCDPYLIGDVDEGDWHSMQDEDRYHYDTFERDGVTCAVRVEWVSSDSDDL